jgi:hypothetical protein
MGGSPCVCDQTVVGVKLEQQKVTVSIASLSRRVNFMYAW